MKAARRLSALAVPVALLFAVVTAHPAATAPPSGCQAQVRDRAQFLAAADSASSDGKTICVSAGAYGEALTLSARHRRMVTFQAVAGQVVTMGALTLEGVDNVRFEGFDMPYGGFTTAESSDHHIQMVSNRIHDCTCQALHLYPGDSDILFQDNFVHDIRYDGSYDSGWGVKADGGERVSILDNTIGNTQDDAMEIGAARNWQIRGNYVYGVHNNPRLASAHADALDLWAGDRYFTIRNNRFIDSTDVLLSGSTTDVVLANNLIAGMSQLCVAAGPTSSSSVGVVRYTWIHNTVYDCGSDYNGGGYNGHYGLVSMGPATGGASNVVKDNILASLDVGTTQQFKYEDDNDIVHGRRLGRHDISRIPRFRNRVRYQPLNLPSAIGYSSAPCGSPLAPAAGS